MPPKDLPQPSPQDAISRSQSGETAQGEGSARPSLFVEAFGTQALRQLTPEELRASATEVVTTQEGFNIGGNNDSSQIRSMTSLRGIPRVVLERRMRSGMTSFLGENEALFEVMADDNDAVVSMGLTHQQIADFLSYFSKAVKYVEEQTGQVPKLIQFNGRTYSYGMTRGRHVGLQSPFDSEDYGIQNEVIRCLDDDSMLHESVLMPTLIRKYGFYGGRAVGGIGPTEIAEMAGFIPRTEKGIKAVASTPVSARARDVWTEMQEKQEVRAWQERVRLVELAKRSGVEAATEGDMAVLITALGRTLKYPLREYRSNELEVMKRLNINPNLIPFAFKGTNPHNLELFEVVNRLYNGQADKIRVADGLPENPTLAQLLEWRLKNTGN